MVKQIRKVTNMKLKYFLYIIGIVFVLSIISNIFQYFKKPTVITKTITSKIDTVRIKANLTAIITAKLKAELKPETIIQIKKIPVKTNIDSVYEIAKEYWLKKIGSQNKDTLNYYNYVAQADTAAKDSLGWVYVRYNSRLPLDPQGYFNINYGWYNRNIINTINTTETIQKKSFFDNLNYSIFVGPGMDLFSHQIGIYAGIGITWNIKKVF